MSTRHCLFHLLSTKGVSYLENVAKCAMNAYSSHSTIFAHQAWCRAQQVSKRVTLFSVPASSAFIWWETCAKWESIHTDIFHTILYCVNALTYYRSCNSALWKAEATVARQSTRKSREGHSGRKEEAKVSSTEKGKHVLKHCYYELNIIIVLYYILCLSSYTWEGQNMSVHLKRNSELMSTSDSCQKSWVLMRSPMTLMCTKWLGDHKVLLLNRIV